MMIDKLSYANMSPKKPRLVVYCTVEVFRVSVKPGLQTGVAAHGYVT